MAKRIDCSLYRYPEGRQKTGRRIFNNCEVEYEISVFLLRHLKAWPILPPPYVIASYVVKIF